MTPVRECQWSWRQLNQSQPWNLEVKKFPAFGNESNECSIKFKNILQEQEGFWTCAARTNTSSSFVQANPIRLLISEGTTNNTFIFNFIKTSSIFFDTFSYCLFPNYLILISLLLIIPLPYQCSLPKTYFPTNFFGYYPQYEQFLSNLFAYSGLLQL